MTAPFENHQKEWLEGFFSGVRVRRQQEAVPEQTSDDLTKEERIKKAQAPLASFETLVRKAHGNAPPEAEDVFRHKWHGLFWLNPVKDGYMCRLRIPGGIVTSHQLRALASAADDLSTGYIQITTRANFQVRVIQPKDCPEFLDRIQACGLHSRGSGADNIRNITASPTAGFDPYEIIDVRPFVRDLAARIANSHAYYDLPRKFNIAIEGGSMISSVQDTNDIGATAVRVAPNDIGLPAGVYFRIALGGATGLKSFAQDAGVLVAPGELVDVLLAIVRVFIRDGDRTNRKRARLKYLLEKRGLDGFRDDFEKELGRSLPRVAPDAPFQSRAEIPPHPHPHVGVFPERDTRFRYAGIAIPVGQVTSDQLRLFARLADEFGRGEVRLTVWQNLLVPGIAAERVEDFLRELHTAGLDTRHSHLRSGFVACTGNRYCKYAATDTKGNALELMHWLDERIPLDRPVNIHLTGCPHSCAQHFIGDIGLLGAKGPEGSSGDHYHVFVGGGFGAAQALGRQVGATVPFDQVKPMVASLLQAYLANRFEGESFAEFCARHDEDALKALAQIKEGAVPV